MLLPLLLNNVLATAGAPPSWTEAVRIGGLAVSAAGAIGTIFLDDVTPVPTPAYFLGGMAHASDGRRYICLWPASNAVHYRGKIACRSDGAMVIIAAGTIGDMSGGWAKTSRGEVIGTVNAYELMKDAIGLLQSGSVCMQAIS